MANKLKYLNYRYAVYKDAVADKKTVTMPLILIKYIQLYATDKNYSFSEALTRLLLHYIVSDTSINTNED